MAVHKHRREPGLVHHFDLVSHWCLAAPAAQVWAALADPESWPAWWPGVRSVHLVHAGEAGGVGRVHQICWAWRWRRHSSLQVERTESLPPERIRSRSRGCGPLRVVGIWLLRAEQVGSTAACTKVAHITQVTHVWRVELQPRWLWWAVPVLALLFRSPHNAVMRAGGEGLARHLVQNMAQNTTQNRAQPPAWGPDKAE